MDGSCFYKNHWFLYFSLLNSHCSPIAATRTVKLVFSVAVLDCVRGVGILMKSVAKNNSREEEVFSREEVLKLTVKKGNRACRVRPATPKAFHLRLFKDRLAVARCTESTAKVK